VAWLYNFVEHPLAYATLKVPTSCLIYFILSTLYVGFTSGRPGGDEDREWWGRLMGWALLMGVTWALVSLIVLMGPSLPWLSDLAQRKVGGSVNWGSIGWASFVATAVSILPTAVAIFGGHSESTSAQEGAALTKTKRLIDASPIIAAHLA